MPYINIITNTGNTARFFEQGWQAGNKLINISITVTNLSTTSQISALISFTQEWSDRLRASSSMITLLEDGEEPWLTRRESIDRVPSFANLQESLQYLRGVYWCNYVSNRVMNSINKKIDFSSPEIFLVNPLRNGIWLQLSPIPPPSLSQSQHGEALLRPLLDHSVRKRQRDTTERGHVDVDEQKLVLLLKEEKISTSMEATTFPPVRFLDSFDVSRYAFDAADKPVAVNLYFDEQLSNEQKILFQSFIVLWGEFLREMFMPTRRLGVVTPLSLNGNSIRFSFDLGTFQLVDAIANLQQTLSNNTIVNVLEIVVGIEEVG